MALEKFCFCCKLENGAFICGVIFTVLHLFALYTFSHNTLWQIVGMAGFENLRKCIMILLAVDAGASILLVLGAVIKSHFAMMPWIVLNGITLIPLLPVAFIAGLMAIPIFFPFYIWWCVCSAYQKVQMKPNDGQTINIYTTSNMVGHSMPPYAPVDQYNTLPATSGSLSTNTVVTVPLNEAPPKYDV